MALSLALLFFWMPGSSVFNFVRLYGEFLNKEILPVCTLKQLPRVL